MRMLDADDPQVAETLGRHLAREFWRGFRVGAVVALVGIILIGLAYCAGVDW